MQATSKGCKRKSPEGLSAISSRGVLAYCDDLDLYCLDRPRRCPWRTVFCTHPEHGCYGAKMEKAWPTWRTWLQKADFLWTLLTASAFNGLSRMRICRVGEPIESIEDIIRITDWANGNPECLFWMPTRSWRNKTLRQALKTLPENVKVLASIDPSNTEAEVQSLVREGFSTMFYGNDSRHPLGNRASVTKCKKTWEHETGRCSRCDEGCFSDKRSDVWLKFHI